MRMRGNHAPVTRTGEFVGQRMTPARTPRGKGDTRAPGLPADVGTPAVQLTRSVVSPCPDCGSARPLVQQNFGGGAGAVLHRLAALVADVHGQAAAGAQAHDGWGIRHGRSLRSGGHHALLYDFRSAPAWVGVGSVVQPPRRQSGFGQDMVITPRCAVLSVPLRSRRGDPR